MRGLSEGAGIPLHEVRLANVFPAVFHCSGFALFGKATRDGRLLHGRILDYMTTLGLQDHAVTIVTRPEGQNAFINLGYAGFVGSVTGVNDKRIAIGQIGGRGEGLWDGMPMAFLFRKALEEAETLDQAVDVFRRTPRTCEYYYVISDGKIPDARGLYCRPDKFVELKPGEKDPPMLTDAVDDAVVFSGPDRLATLLKRIRAGYAKLTPPGAIRLMERPASMESNLKNVLFAPQTLELWVAHAARPDTPRYQACWQPYVHYDGAALLRQIADMAGEGKEEATGSRSERVIPAEQIGVVHAEQRRPVASKQDP
jgi:hypothetical protein